MLITFHLYLRCFRNSEKTNFGSLGSRLEAETQFRSPQGLEQQK
jgi:hypothetical protein